jgi:hypothetical protein
MRWSHHSASRQGCRWRSASPKSGPRRRHGGPRRGRSARPRAAASRSPRPMPPVRPPGAVAPVMLRVSRCRHRVALQSKLRRGCPSGVCDDGAEHTQPAAGRRLLRVGDHQHRIPELIEGSVEAGGGDVNPEASASAPHRNGGGEKSQAAAPGAPDGLRRARRRCWRKVDVEAVQLGGRSRALQSTANWPAPLPPSAPATAGSDSQVIGAFEARNRTTIVNNRLAIGRPPLRPWTIPRRFVRRLQALGAPPRRFTRSRPSGPVRRHTVAAAGLRLLELAREWSMVIDDDPYGLLRFAGEPCRRCVSSAGATR